MGDLGELIVDVDLLEVEVDRLIAENDRLRKAIKGALEYIDNYDGQGSFLTALEEKLSAALATSL